MERWNFTKIDEALTAAALDPGFWPKALDCVSVETSSQCSLRRPSAGRIDDLDADDQSSLLSDKIVQTYRIIPPRRPSGDRDSFSPDFMSGWFAEITIDLGGAVWRLSVQREVQNDPPFSVMEQQNLGRLSQSLSRAAMITKALARASVSAALEAFDIGKIAVILITGHRDVIHVNKDAKKLLRSSAKIVHKRLTLADPNATAELDNALSQLLSAKMENPILPVRLPRRGRSPILAHPLKLKGINSSMMEEPLAAVVLIDPSSHRKSSEASLHVAFRLTPAEARLAAKLATGEPLNEICHELEISKETGRNQLKSIFAKTGTRRQAELVLLMAKML